MDRDTALTRDGHAVLLDFERTALGPPQWDLTSTAVASDTLGNLSPTAYQHYADAYGQDVRTWKHYPLYRDIRELRLITFAFQTADHTPTALPEAHHRLACLKGDRGSRPWGWTPVG
ncbi:hypothetical protein ACIP88_33660 [Streptomyces uncialis]|uniref:hypothetical protein n=1 Tax=Streptomyces uncialis TaxID=1048205 RepID=UPI00382B1D73